MSGAVPDRPIATNRDRAETEDLAHIEPELANDLQRDLASTRWEPVSASQTNQLDPELEERLPAFGYL